MSTPFVAQTADSVSSLSSFYAGIADTICPSPRSIQTDVSAVPADAPSLVVFSGGTAFNSVAGGLSVHDEQV